MKKRIKATSFWWERKVIYNLKSVAWWLASMKVSEKHQKLEKSKKKQIQILSSNVSEIFINQQKQTEQNKKNDSKKVFIKKNKN